MSHYLRYLRNKYFANIEAMKQFENSTTMELLSTENKAIERTFAELKLIRELIEA